MSEKDFLSQFVKDEKPDSFKEEELTPIKKEKKPIKPWMVAIPAALVVFIIFLVWFFFLRATIEMPNFVGETRDDLARWVNQYGIETSGIVFDEDYSMEYDANVITYQSVDEGTKVKENVKINFGLSLGPNPDDEIEVPNLREMNRAEIEAWIEENKLINTRITQTYSSTVEDGGFIEASYRGCDELSFTRGCTLNITVSRGEAPAGSITVENFVNGDVANVRNWANKNKITLVVNERYDDTIAANMVISQSLNANTTVKEGDTLTVVVSRGQGTTVPNFANMTKSQVDNWVSENAAVVSVIKYYSTSKAYVISQSAKAGEQVGVEDKLELKLNQGDGFYMADIEGAPENIIGTQYTRLSDWCESLREYGISAYAGAWSTPEAVYSNTYEKGAIISVKCISNSTKEEYNCSGKLPLDACFDVVISKGKGVQLNLDLDCTTVSELVDFMAANNMNYRIERGTNNENRAILELNGKSVYEGDYLYTDRTYDISSGGRVYPCVVDEPIVSNNPETE